MSVFASSTFTAPDGTALAGFEGWTVHPTSMSARMEIRDGRAGVSSSGDIQLYYINTHAPSADCEVGADIYLASGTGGHYGICARMDPVAGTYYYARLSAGQVQLYKAIAGTLTQLGSSYSVGAMATGGTHRIGLRVEGSTIKVLWNGVEVISRADDSIAAAGYTGFRCAQVSMRPDNFSASTLGAAGVSASVAALETGDASAIAGVVSFIVGLSASAARAIGVSCQIEAGAPSVLELTAAGRAVAVGVPCRTDIVVASVVGLAVGEAGAEGVSASAGTVVTERVALSVASAVRAVGVRAWSGGVYQTYGFGAYFAEDYVGVVADCALLAPPRAARAAGVRASLGEGRALACAGAAARGVRAGVCESVFFGCGLAQALGVRASADDKVSCTVGAAKAYGNPARVNQHTDVLLSFGTGEAFGVPAIAADGVLFGVGICEALGINAPLFAEEIVYIEGKAGVAAGMPVPVGVSEGTEMGCQPGVAQSMGLDLEIGAGVDLRCGTAATAAIPVGITAYTRGVPLNARITLSYARPVVASIT